MFRASDKFFRFTLLSVSFLTIMASTSVSPLLGSLARAFPQSSMIEIKMVLTLPAIVSLISSQICGYMSLFFSRKKLLLTGIGIYTIGGCLSILHASLHLLILLRFVVGIGLGMITPLSTGLIADYYGKKQRSHLIGVSQAVAQIGSMAGTLFAGLVADWNWRLAFLTYAAGIPIFMLVLIVLPDTPNTVQKTKTSVSHFPIIGSIFPLFLTSLVFSLIFSSITTNISQYVEILKLHTSSAGVGICIMAFGGLLGSIAVPKALEKLKKLTLPILMLLIALGFLALAFSTSLLGLMLSLFLLGLSGGAFGTGVIAVTARQTSSNEHTLGIAIVSAGNSIGTFLTPFLFAVTAYIIRTNSLTVGFLLNAAECLLAAFLLLVVTHIRRKI